jgi:uncharacterized protein DUF4345
VNGPAHQRGQRRLRIGLYLGGLVATSAGLHTLIAGGKSFPPWRKAGAMVESELRYYSAFYVAYGLHVLRAAGRADHDPRALQELAAALFLAGLGRAGAWLTVGKPHPVQRALLAIELAAPPLALLEQARDRSTTPDPRP